MGRIDIDTLALESEIHGDSGDIPNMVIVLMSDENRLKFLLSLKG